jgi:hypothetical protein
MKRIAALLTIIAALTAGAQTIPPIVYDIEADFQQTQALPDQSFVQGAGVALRYRLKSQGRWLSLGGLGARWDARALSTSTQALQQAATVVTNVTPNYFQVLLTSAQTGSAVTNWTHSLIVTLAGTDYPIGAGELDIAASAWTGAAAILSNTTAAAYTDAAVASHAGVIAASNVLGHIKVGAGLTIDGNGLLEATAGASDHTTLGNLHWTASGHTGTPGRIAGFFEGGAAGYATVGTDLELDGSEGINVTSTLQTVTGRGATTTNAVTVASLESPIVKATTTAGVTIQAANGTPAMIIGPANTAAVSTLDGLSVAGSLQVQGTNVMTELAGKVATNDTRYLAALTNAAAFSPAGALPTTGGIMTGSIQDSFGSASINPSARTLHNSFEDLTIDWNSLTLYNGSVLDPRLAWGLNTLYGTWKSEGTATNGTEIVNYQTMQSATRDPYKFAYATNITISATNGIQQALTNLTGALTITWPAGDAATETTISLTVPPRGTNAYTLAAGPTYYYVSPLTSTNALSTNLITRLWYASPWGTTNASVTISGEVAP